MQRVLDAMTGAPAFIRNGRLDILATNPLGRALYSPVFANPANRANLARFRFLDPASGAFYPDWHESATSLNDAEPHTHPTDTKPTRP